MINNDILASSYALMGDVSEEELPRATALEQLGSVLNMMQYEKVFGNLDDVITKSELSFTDTTGVKANTLTDFGDVVFLRWNGVSIEECPVSQLDMYADMGLQRVAFWTDESGSSFIQLAIAEMGTLMVWYEPEIAHTANQYSLVTFRDSLRWCIATRHAHHCLPYVIYKDPAKAANKPYVLEAIREQKLNWDENYKMLVNKIGTGRPFSKLPFAAGLGDDF